MRFHLFFDKNYPLMFTGTEKHDIPLPDAAVLTKNYRDQFGPGVNYIKAEYFSQESINSILAQANCIGLRIYYGLDDNGIQRLVVVGVTADQNDMTSGVILENGVPCPQYCSTSNPLNS
jgi:hypothetical protein